MKNKFNLNDLIVFVGELKGVNMFNNEGLEMLRDIQSILIKLKEMQDGSSKPVDDKNK